MPGESLTALGATSCGRRKSWGLAAGLCTSCSRTLRGKPLPEYARDPRSCLPELHSRDRRDCAIPLLLGSPVYQRLGLLYDCLQPVACRLKFGGLIHQAASARAVQHHGSAVEQPRPNLLVLLQGVGVLLP